MSDISATATVAELNAQLAEAEAEIERLRGVEKDAAEWVEERTKRIRADNALLRAALREIVDLAAWEPTRATNIARSALDEK